MAVRTRTLICVSELLLLLGGWEGVETGQAADWSRFRGPNGAAVSDARGLPVKWDDRSGVIWKSPLPGPGSSSPIVVGDRVLLTCYSGYGVNRDKPGFAMKRFPVVGETYRQEFSLNNAEDAAQVLTLTGSATVPAASCNGNCLITREFSPIIPSLLEDKYFAPGVGFILETKPGTTDRLELVQIIQN